MADSAHLEKMGRELKCPICLSLLNSAVSLTCNHVFCNLCIVKSMKSDSNCPVCKVPYRRREVRPAPHMDNLVSIYKSMEVASGINIFVSQTAPSNKISDGKKQAEGESKPGRPETGGTSCGKSNKQRGKYSKKLVKTNAKISGPHLEKPSFPTKKRVQVPQYPLSDTPTWSEKCEVGGSSKITENGTKNDSDVLKEKPAINEKGEPIFSPFFWLRDEDDDKPSTQQMENERVIDTPLNDVPSFSDIKDSDDDISTKMTPNGEVGSEFKVADVFDSEMFEWTQRACSPELCSTPMKIQVASSDESDEIQEKECEAAPQISIASTSGEEPISENAKSVNAKQGTKNTQTEKAKDQIGIKKSNKRGRTAIRRPQRKRAKILLNEVFGEENLHQEQKCESNGNAKKLEKKISKRKKKATFENTATEVLEGVPTVAVAPKSLNQGNWNMSTELPVSLGKKEDNDENLNLKYDTSKDSNKINKKYQKDHPKRSKNRNFDARRTKALKGISINQDRGNDIMKTKLPVFSCPKDDADKAADLGENVGEKANKINILVQGNIVRDLRGGKRSKITIDDRAKDRLAGDVLDGSSKAATKEIQTTRVINNSETIEKILPAAKDMLLRKCESFPNQILCAFCQSSEESEASGEMMHYFNGRPVASDYNGGSNVIHSHKNCTEWAPNVYFNDDTAINLETELARSKRIKCSCCGVKGAALGCYEKSCRKSFHIPCAKLVHQCRWDTDNFVILCPLHSSSKLPSEVPGHQGERRKRCVPKGESHTQQAQGVTKHDASASRPWKCPVSPNKCVFCCSALTIAEKETVSEFVRLAGVTVSKTWSSNVTHVIASTDENGACKRTFKFLMGIMEGKWILKIDWIKACMKAMEPVKEEQYEISVDIHGIRDGPRLGRLRVVNKQPKLFNRFKFYFNGEFVPSYKGYLQDLVVAAGGTVLQRKPISGDQERQLSGSSKSTVFIIYSLELPNKCDSGKKAEILKRRQVDAEALASLTGTKVAGHSWVLDSIAACKLLNLVQ